LAIRITADFVIRVAPAYGGVFFKERRGEIHLRWAGILFVECVEPQALFHAGDASFDGADGLQILIELLLIAPAETAA